MIRPLLPVLALSFASGCASLDVRSEGPGEGERAPEVMLRDDGWNKVRAGITTISEVVRATKG